MCKSLKRELFGEEVIDYESSTPYQENRYHDVGWIVLLLIPIFFIWTAIKRIFKC